MEEIKLLNPVTIIALIILSLLIIVLVLQLIIFHYPLMTRRTCRYCGAIHTKKSGWAHEYWVSDINNKNCICKIYT